MQEVTRGQHTRPLPLLEPEGPAVTSSPCALAARCPDTRGNAQPPGEPGRQGSTPHQAPVGWAPHSCPHEGCSSAACVGGTRGGERRGGKERGEWVGPRGPWWALRAVEAAEHGHCHPQGRPCLRHPISAGRACSPVPQARDSRSPGKDCEKPAGKLRLDGGSAVQPSVARPRGTRLAGDRPSAVSSQQAPPPGDRPGSGRCAGEASTCCHMSLALTPTLRSGVTSPVPRGGSRRGSTCREQKGGHWAVPAPRGSPRTPGPQLLPLHPECVHIPKRSF